MASEKSIVWLKDSDEPKLVGGKAAALGQLVLAGFNVPPGFVITTLAGPLPNKFLEPKILAAFDKLGTNVVAVRSSAGNEDGENTAWAGQLDTILNVARKDLLEKVIACQQSVSSKRALAYAAHQNKTSGQVAVLVQKMIQSEVAGVAFSVHPVTQDNSQIIINAALGLGEAVVSGEVTPDSYVIDKKSDKVIEKIISEQTQKLSRHKKGGNIWRLAGQKGFKQKLSSEQISKLTKAVIDLEKFYNFPIDIEWAFSSNQLFILQCRPITTLR